MMSNGRKAYWIWIWKWKWKIEQHTGEGEMYERCYFGGGYWSRDLKNCWVWLEGLACPLVEWAIEITCFISFFGFIWLDMEFSSTCPSSILKTRRKKGHVGLSVYVLAVSEWEMWGSEHTTPATSITSSKTTPTYHHQTTFFLTQLFGYHLSSLPSPSSRFKTWRWGSSRQPRGQANAMPEDWSLDSLGRIFMICQPGTGHGVGRSLATPPVCQGRRAV